MKFGQLLSKIEGLMVNSYVNETINDFNDRGLDSSVYISNQDKKKAEDFEAFRLNRPTWINSACCRSENRLQQLLVGQQLAWRPGSSPDSKRVKNNI